EIRSGLVDPAQRRGVEARALALERARARADVVLAAIGVERCGMAGGAAGRIGLKNLTAAFGGRGQCSLRSQVRARAKLESRHEGGQIVEVLRPPRVVRRLIAGGLAVVAARGQAAAGLDPADRALDVLELVEVARPVKRRRILHAQEARRVSRPVREGPGAAVRLSLEVAGGARKPQGPRPLRPARGD